jgi:hypothetical protein
MNGGVPRRMILLAKITWETIYEACILSLQEWIIEDFEHAAAR